MDVLVHTLSRTAKDPTPAVPILRRLLAPFYTVQPINAPSLASQPWPATCALLVLLPGDVLGSATMPPKSLQAVQSYVERGGRVLALGLGAQTTRSHPGEALHLWDPSTSAAICVFKPVTADAAPFDVALTSGGVVRGLPRADVQIERGAGTVLAKFGEDVVAAEINVGAGKAAFWDLVVGDDPASKAVTDTLKHALSSLGLRVPLSDDPKSSETLDEQIPPVPTRPLPQFLVSPRTKPDILASVLRSLWKGASSGTSPYIIADFADTFHFHRVTSEEGLKQVSQARDEASDATEPQPRQILLLPAGELPSKAMAPRFDVAKFFDELAAGGDVQLSGTHTWGMGEALFYGEAVTSTQTMLERNPTFLSSLPPPIVSLASFQLAGRGRGSNTWLSSTGCLQFSLLLRAPLSAVPAPRLVFVQYLFGLSVVAACRDARALGGAAGAPVRLKWPNDIYVDLAGGAGKKKIGGILVNTSFSGGSVDIIADGRSDALGCGVNVSTPAPMASLSLLDPRITSETMLALILTKFERMWGTFVDGRGSWAPFEDAYLDAWMHSDQLVAVTTVTPPQQVRILGITPDHGLLRTLPERGAGGFIDLQPDGNSFDIMAGLIKAKS
ncbi:hypothetical protein OF83DRAFT_1169368 [Amylostereum chailletii]|nr:hypothetical protein OF83DRAFT_1169368 [Amylostereum chailletii]